MKNSKLKKLITKVLGALLLVSVLVGTVTVSFPTSAVYAAEGVAELEARTDVAWGSSAITDPQKVDTEKGTYYAPTSYIYCGTYFDEETLSFIPVLCRVLDADADNTGSAGAMFLLTENAINSGAFFYNYNSAGFSNMVFVDWENIYTASNMHIYSQSKIGFPLFSSAKTSEKAYIRPITKTDTKESMKNLYGYEEGTSIYYFETDYIDNPEIHYYGWGAAKGDSAQYLQNTPYFLLSVDEINKYIGTYNTAPGLGTTNLKKQGATWLTRTGLGESYDDSSANVGNYVAGVDGMGNIVPVSADDKTAYARIAFNLEKSNIVFTQSLGNSAYRVAFTHPEYDAALMGEDLVPFTAKVINTDTEKNKVTIEYNNTYRLTAGGGRISCISVIIEDAYGNIKSYGNINTLPTGHEYLDTVKGTAEFVLPENYDRAKDKIHVFWENKPEDDKGISYVSNMVELECLHTAYDKATDTHGTAPNCISEGVCALCGEKFGYIIPDAHTVDITEYHCDHEDGVDLHWNICTVCNEELNIKSCTFEPVSGRPCLLVCDTCTTSKYDRSRCQYDENGFCIYDADHLEAPTYVTGTGYVEAIIENEGQWISLANTINKGEIVRDENGNTVYIGGGTVDIILTSDLDFTGISGFVPMGTEENSAKGSLYCRGGEFTIKGIRYESDGANVGLFGFAERMMIRNITLTDCSFKGGANVGALAGKASDVYVSETKVIGGVTVSAADGSEGAFFGAVVSGEFIDPSKITFASVAYGVTNEAGDNIPFVPSSVPVMTEGSEGGAVSISGSFCLAESDDEARGCASAETFASGLVAYRLQNTVPGWSQIIDKTEINEETGEEKTLTPEAFPRYIPKGENGNRVEKTYRVYMVAYCDGTPSKLTNNARKDYTVHKPTEVVEWMWDELLYCDALVRCELCGEEVLMEASVTLDYTYVPVRGDYTATLLDPNGIPYVDGEGNEFTNLKTVIGIHIEDMIGMTYIEKVYDGLKVSPEDMMDNHRLNEGTPYPAAKEYDVYFLDENGERIVKVEYDYYGQPQYVPASVSDVGVYDLLVVGRKGKDYEGQSYIYKGALTITPAVVEIEPQDVYKYHDGTAVFTPEYKAVYTGYYEFNVIYGEAESSDEGVYDIPVSVEHYMGDDNVKFVLTRDSVKAAILPALFVKVENKDYPTKFTYGDALTTPTAEHFTFTEGSELTFEWYAANVDRWLFDENGEFVEQYEVLYMRRIDGMPKNAGDYVLRVKASGVGTLAASYCDVVINISPRDSLGLTLNTEGFETYSDGYNTYYIIEPGQLPNGFEYTISGLVEGDTIESAGISVYIQSGAAEGGGSAFSGFPQKPSARNYDVWYYVYCNTEDGREGNYAAGKVFASVYVMVKSDAYARPVAENYIEDGKAKEIDVVLSWQAVEGASVYKLVVTDPDGTPTEFYRSVGDELAEDIRYGNIFADYTLTKEGTYAVTVYADDVFAESYSFDVAITNEGGEGLTEMVDMGRYTVTVTSGDEVHSAEMIIQREIVMLVKEMEYNLFGGELEFDRTKVIMEAGKVILIGHRLEEVKLSINPDTGSVWVESFRVVRESDGADVTYLYSLKNHVSDWDGPVVNVVHVFDSACDAECNVCDYVRVAAHTGGTATCVSQAICEHCHTPYGEFDTYNHVSDKTHIAPNGENLETHLRIHSCCGQTAEVLPHTEGKAATCISRAVCADCGWEYGEIDPHNHASDALTYEYVGEAGHKAIHSECCNSYAIEEHTGGEATCTELAKCEHCEKGYGTYDADNHSGITEYAPDPENAGAHIEKYNCCNKSASVAHSGGTETCTSLAVCEHCKAEYGELDPHNHASEKLVYTVRADNASMHDITHECCGAFVSKEYHTGGKATCVSHAVCDLCKAEYGGATDESNHVSEEIVYKRDAVAGDIHIAVHACCGEEISREAHTGGKATCTSGKLCEHCGAEYGEPIPHEFDNACDSYCNICEKQVRPLVFHTDTDGDDKCNECGAAIDEAPAHVAEPVKKKDEEEG